MSNSLRDQLIKAGVVTQEQADKVQAEQKAERDARRARQRSGGAGSKDGRRDGRGKNDGKNDGKSGSKNEGRSGGKSGGKKDAKAGGASRSESRHARGGGRGRSGNADNAGRPRRDRTPQDDSPAAVKARAAAQALARDDRAVKALTRAAEGSEKTLRDELRRFIAAYDQRAKEQLDSDEPYHFAHNKKIKRIYLPTEQIDDLSRGALVVVNHDGRYALLPFGPACAVAAVESRRIIAAHLESASTEEESLGAADVAASEESPTLEENLAAEASQDATAGPVTGAHEGGEESQSDVEAVASDNDADQSTREPPPAASSPSSASSDPAEPEEPAAPTSD